MERATVRLLLRRWRGPFCIRFSYFVVPSQKYFTQLMSGASWAVPPRLRVASEVRLDASSTKTRPPAIVRRPVLLEESLVAPYFVALQRGAHWRSRAPSLCRLFGTRHCSGASPGSRQSVWHICRVTQRSGDVPDPHRRAAWRGGNGAPAGAELQQSGGQRFAGCGLEPGGALGDHEVS